MEWKAVVRPLTPPLTTWQLPASTPTWPEVITSSPGAGEPITAPPSIPEGARQSVRNRHR
jgi:hypothetical protein